MKSDGRNYLLYIGLAVFLALAGCGDPGGSSQESTNDAGANNTGTNDGGPNNTGTNDGGTNDAGSNNGGTSDGGTNDGGTNNDATNNTSSSPCADTTCLTYMLSSLTGGTDEVYYVDLANPGQPIRIDDASKTSDMETSSVELNSSATAFVFARAEENGEKVYRVDLSNPGDEQLISEDYPGGTVFSVPGTDRFLGYFYFNGSQQEFASFVATNPVSYDRLHPPLEELERRGTQHVINDGETIVLSLRFEGKSTIYKRPFDGSGSPEELIVDGSVKYWDVDARTNRIALLVEKDGQRTVQIGSVDTWNQRETVATGNATGEQVLVGFGFTPSPSELIIDEVGNASAQVADRVPRVTLLDLDSGTPIIDDVAYGQGGGSCRVLASNSDYVLCTTNIPNGPEASYVIDRNDPSDAQKLLDQRTNSPVSGLEYIQGSWLYFKADVPGTERTAILRTDLAAPGTVEEVLPGGGEDDVVGTGVSENGEWLLYTTVVGSVAEGHMELYVARFDALDSPIQIASGADSETPIIGTEFVNIMH